MNDNWEQELQGEQTESDFTAQTNADILFMEKYGITNNIFYTIFTAPMDYFRVCVLSMLFLDVQQRVKPKVFIFFIIFAVLNRVISLSAHVMISSIELVTTFVIIVVWLRIFETLTLRGKTASQQSHSIPVDTEFKIETVDEPAEVSTKPVRSKGENKQSNYSASMADVMQLVTEALDSPRPANSMKQEDHLANTLLKVMNSTTADFPWLNKEAQHERTSSY